MSFWWLPKNKCGWVRCAQHFFDRRGRLTKKSVVLPTTQSAKPPAVFRLLRRPFSLCEKGRLFTAPTNAKRRHFGVGRALFGCKNLAPQFQKHKSTILQRKPSTFLIFLFYLLFGNGCLRQGGKKNEQRKNKREEYQKETTISCRKLSFLFGGSGWIRTTEVEDNRFTVCPLWPLGNTPILSFVFCFQKTMELVDGLEPPTC